MAAKKNAHIYYQVAKAASRCCELANPAQMRQIASQTGDLLRQMRFVAGRGAVAKRLVRGAAVAERHRENVASQGSVAKILAGCAR